MFPGSWGRGRGAEGLSRSFVLKENPVTLVTDLGEVAYIPTGRTRLESEPVEFPGGATRPGYCVHRGSGGDCDRGRVLNETTAKAVSRIAEVWHRSADATPFDVERIDDALDQISQRSRGIETVWDRKGIEHANVSCVQRGSSVLKIDMRTSFWNIRYPCD
jgi:hypothetical protein